MGITAKEYLNRLKLLDLKINQKLEEVSALKQTLTSISAVITENERVQGGNIKLDASFVKLLTRINKMEQEIDKEIDTFVCEKHRTINEIQSLKNKKHIEILYKRYVEFKDLGIVADEMNYTYQYIVLLHGYALQEFYEKFQYKFNV